MSDAAAEYRRVQTAYEQPTLTLVHQKHAVTVLTCFRTLFSTENPTAPTARMHDQVDQILADLRLADLPNVPTMNGRDACQKWVKDGWLLRLLDDSNDEVYQLTSHALDGLRTVDRLTKDRSVSLSQHLISGLVRHLRDFAATLSPDKTAYVNNLLSEMARIDAEIKRVRDENGDLHESSDDDIVQGVVELQRFLAELPGDFTRVVESYREFEHDTIAEFRAEAVSSGEAVRRYLAHAEQLPTASAAGRGFNGALELLRDDALLDEVNRYISTLLDSERATFLLSADERAEVRNTVKLIDDGLKRVLEQRSKVSRALHDYITSHDVDSNYELATTLRELEVEMRIWMQTAGPRAKAPLPLLPGKPDIQHLKTKLYDPADDLPPPPLEKIVPPDTLSRLSLADMRARGGPSHAALREQLAGKFESGGGVESLAELFNTLPDDLRRPVEILGVLPLARRSGLAPSGEIEVFESVRSDGSRRRFNVPAYAQPRTRDPSADHPGYVGTEPLADATLDAGDPGASGAFNRSSASENDR